MHRRQFLFLSGSTLAGLPALTAAAQSAPGLASPESGTDPDAFRFAIISDLTGGERPGIFEDAVRKLNMLQPEFVMSVGDLIQGYTGDEAELIRQWEDFDARAGQLTMPFFYLPGNHDISGPFPVSEEVWRKRYGPTYYSFAYKGALFLCLNTEDPPREDNWSAISDDQLAMIRRALDENPNPRWVFVFMHRPIWADCPEARPELWAPIEALLRDLPYTVFAGHLHLYTRYRINDRDHYTLGVTGGINDVWETTFGAFDHVVWVTMANTGPAVANLMLDGIAADDIVLSDDAQAAMSLRGARSLVDAQFSEPAPLDAGRGRTTLTLRNDSKVQVDVSAEIPASARVALLPATIKASLAPESEQLVTLDYAPVPSDAPQDDAPEEPARASGVFTFTSSLPSGADAYLCDLRRTFWASGEEARLAGGVRYDFDGDTLEGWTATGMVNVAVAARLDRDKEVRGVYGELLPEFRDAHLTSPPALSLDANHIDTVTVRLKNESNANGIDLYWITDEDDAWSVNDKVIHLSQNAHSAHYATYSFDTHSQAAWRGVITQFRIVVGRRWGGPSDATSGHTHVDFIEAVRGEA